MRLDTDFALDNIYEFASRSPGRFLAVARLPRYELRSRVSAHRRVGLVGRRKVGVPHCPLIREPIRALVSHREDESEDCTRPALAVRTEQFKLPSSASLSAVCASISSFPENQARISRSQTNAEV